MNTNRDLNYRLYLQREEGFHRISFSSEFEKYKIISSGDVKKSPREYRRDQTEFLPGSGHPFKRSGQECALSPYRCGGADLTGLRGKRHEHDLAYTLSDIYIQRADECERIDRMIDMLGEMQLDYAERMREIKKEHVGSIHVRKCMDYIYEHLQEKMTIEGAAAIYRSTPHIFPSYFPKRWACPFGSSSSTPESMPQKTCWHIPIFPIWKSRCPWAFPPKALSPVHFAG